MLPIVEQYIAMLDKAEGDYTERQGALQADMSVAESAARAEMAPYPRFQSTRPTYSYSSNTNGWWQANNSAPVTTPQAQAQMREVARQNRVAEAKISEARNAYYDAMHEVGSVRQQARQDAWEMLATSDDPLIKYIHEHCHSYRGHAQRILEILPADLPAMQEVARKGNWCEVFDGFVAGAVRQKLIVDDRSPQRRRLEKYLHDEEIDSDVQTRIVALVDAEVKMAVKKALTAERRTVREAKAKAIPKATPKAATPQAVTA